MKETIKRRYEQVAGYTLKPFGAYTKEEEQQTRTDKSKSKEHGEVFTPLWLVDEMVQEMMNQQKGSTLVNKMTSDCCAGYGAFTIRMLEKLKGPKRQFNWRKWLKKNHLFTEYQISSALKLIYIFGKDINLLVGDSNAGYDWMLSKDSPGVGIRWQCGKRFIKRDKFIDAFLAEVTEDNWEKMVEKHAKIIEESDLIKIE